MTVCVFDYLEKRTLPKTHLHSLRLSASNRRSGQNSLTWHNLLSHINSTGTFTRSLCKHFDYCETWFCCFAVAVAAIAAPVSSYPLHSTRNKNDSNYRDWGLREGRREGTEHRPKDNTRDKWTHYVHDIYSTHERITRFWWTLKQTLVQFYSYCMYTAVLGKCTLQIHERIWIFCQSFW